jgi:hypothetical protein
MPWLPFGWARGEGSPEQLGVGVDCLLLDLRAECSLPESLAGYEAALSGAQLSYARAVSVSGRQCHWAVVPAATVLGVIFAQSLSVFLEDGGCLLLESGLGFVDHSTSDVQRRLLRSHLGVQIEPPVDLWAAAGGHCHVPYVDYLWPLQAKVRDFSRVVPVSPRGGDVIAWTRGLPVALKQKVGKGTLVFLGSPLGPALLAGDPQARRWFSELLATTSPSQVNRFRIGSHHPVQGRVPSSGVL